MNSNHKCLEYIKLSYYLYKNVFIYIDKKFAQIEFVFFSVIFALYTINNYCNHDIFVSKL